MSRFIGYLTVCILSVLVSSSTIVHAQAARSEITGQVRDQLGAVIPQASVRVTQDATNQTVASTTGATGLFTLTNLKPGLYTITVEAQGFKLVRGGVQLVTGERTHLDIALVWTEVQFLILGPQIGTDHTVEISILLRRRMVKTTTN